MTKSELVGYLETVPPDCLIISNSGKEFESVVGGIWYNPATNECHLTQGGAVENEYGYKSREGFVKIMCEVY